MCAKLIRGNYELRIMNYECEIMHTIENNLQGSLTAKQINRFARHSGLIAEVNTEQGFIELLDNELRKVAVAERIFI